LDLADPGCSVTSKLAEIDLEQLREECTRQPFATGLAVSS
jgi:hypothetical protein